MGSQPRFRVLGLSSTGYEQANLDTSVFTDKADLEFNSSLKVKNAEFLANLDKAKNLNNKLNMQRVVEQIDTYQEMLKEMEEKCPKKQIFNQLNQSFSVNQKTEANDFNTIQNYDNLMNDDIQIGKELPAIEMGLTIKPRGKEGGNRFLTHPNFNTFEIVTDNSDLPINSYYQKEEPDFETSEQNSGIEGYWDV